MRWIHLGYEPEFHQMIPTMELSSLYEAVCWMNRADCGQQNLVFGNLVSVGHLLWVSFARSRRLSMQVKIKYIPHFNMVK